MAGITILSFAYVLSQFYRSFLAVLTPILSSELGMSESQLSYASGAWFAAFALAQFPVGKWLDDIGPRKTASLTLGIFASGGISLFAASTGPIQIIISMALIGFGCSSILMAAYMLFSRNYSPAIFATLCSLFLAVGQIGNVAGAEPLAYAVIAWGWRSVSAALAVFTLIVAIGSFMTVKDPQKAVNISEGSVFDLLKIRQLWLLFPIITCSYSIPTSIRSLWAGPYLANVHGLDIIAIGRIVLFMALAQIIGTLVYGPLDRLFNTRKWIVVTGNILLISCCIWLALNPQALLANITLVFVGMSIFGSASAVQLAHGKSFVPVHMTGRGLTILNFFAIGGVAIMQLAGGVVVKTYTIADEPAAAYEALFTFYVLMLGLVIGIYLFCIDKKPR